MNLSPAELWHRVPKHTQRQIKKATLAAVVAFGTVIAAPLLNPLHSSHRTTHRHDDDAPTTRTHAASHEGRQHRGHHGKGGRGHG